MTVRKRLGLAHDKNTLEWLLESKMSVVCDYSKEKGLTNVKNTLKSLLESKVSLVYDCSIEEGSYSCQKII